MHKKGDGLDADDAHTTYSPHRHRVASAGHRAANELGGGWSLYLSLSFRPNPSIGAVKLSLRDDRFFPDVPSIGLPYDTVLPVDVLVEKPIAVGEVLGLRVGGVGSGCELVE